MRPYVADLPGGTATTSVQLTAKSTVKRVLLTFLSTAAGKIEISRSSASQIGTASPTRDVLARVNCSGTAGNVVVYVDLIANNVFQQLDYLYIHQTGSGNLGDVVFHA